MANTSTSAPTAVSTGPVSFPDGVASLRRVQGVPSSPAWVLSQVGDDVFCFHDKGIFLVKGGSAVRITDVMGAWACQQVKGRPDLLLVGVYNGVYVLRKSAGQWKSLGKIQGIYGSGRYLHSPGGRTLVVYHPNEDKAVIYQLDASLMRVVSSRLVHARYHAPWAGLGTQPSKQWDFTGTPNAISRDRVIIPFTNGYLLLNRQKEKGLVPKVCIYNMYISYPKDSLVYTSNFAGMKPTPKIQYRYNSVRFEFGVVPQSAGGVTLYQYRLNGGEWSSASTGTAKEYSSLAGGKYVFEVRSLSDDGRKSVDSIAFQILPPWYQSSWAFVAYAILLVISMWCTYVLESRRVRRREQVAIVEKSKEVDQMKVTIDKLEKDKMDLDLRHKSQEIANLVNNVARKNEILSNIKDDIKRVMVRMGLDTPSEIKRQLATVTSKISSNMEGDEVLSKFEEQFDLANNNLIHKLRSRYPSLSHNELMMCAYLKMNLSTKEMAPLLNLSVRGVETLRYRLRKKLGMERNDSLTEFLNHFE